MTRGQRMFWQWRACRVQSSLLAGIVFDHSKLSLTTWFLALCAGTDASSGVCYRNAWRLRHKLMQAMGEREADRRLGDLVQIDNAYLGGEHLGGKPGQTRRTSALS